MKMQVEWREESLRLEMRYETSKASVFTQVVTGETRDNSVFWSCPHNSGGGIAFVDAPVAPYLRSARRCDRSLRPASLPVSRLTRDTQACAFGNSHLDHVRLSRCH